MTRKEKTQKELFSCQDINWRGLEILLREMAGEEIPPEQQKEMISLLEPELIKTHISQCPTCAEKFSALADKYPIRKHQRAK